MQGKESSPAIPIRIVDSHTGGEPTRLVVEGGPDLGAGPLSERVRTFADRFDAYRSAIVNEPRGSDTVVGALLCKPYRPECDFGVIFFNNVGYLGMCGHGTIGLIVSLAHLGLLAPGAVNIDTPVGVVSARLEGDDMVTVANVPSYRQAHRVAVDVPDVGIVIGDIAWGGNWFFLVEHHSVPLEPSNVEALTDYAWRVRQALNSQGHPEVDHIELFAAPASAAAHSRNFVLCPGKEYDRSPCGTGTSAKLACLAANGRLAEGQAWVQEGILGTTFTGHYRWLDKTQGEIAPTVTGTAYVTAEATLLLNPRDPFCWGIRGHSENPPVRRSA